MKLESTHASQIGRQPHGALLRSALCISLLCFSSCGPKDGGPKDAGRKDAGPGAGTSKAKGGGAAATKPAPAVIEAKPIDLGKIATFGGAELTGMSAANATYKAKGDVKPVFEFHRKQFLDLGWKEMPESSVTDQSASATFTGAGYKISATVYSAGTPGSVEVMLHNHGNVDLSKLPLPSGTKPVYVGAVSAMHVTEAPVADTKEAVRRLLTAAGWEPHGNEGDTWHYKQGLNRLSATISSAPAQGGKTMINYGCELMAGDLPAPPDAKDVRYVATQRKLTFETVAEKDAVVAYYKQALGKTGWKPNREETIQVDDKDEMVFRNGDGIVFLEMRRESDGKRQVTLASSTVTEMEAAGKRIREKLAAEKKAQPAEAPVPMKPKVSVVIPPGASGIDRTGGGLKFSVGNGKAKGVAEGWRKPLAEAGWKEDAASLDAMAGVMSFTKDGASLTINYTDTGFTPAEVSISGIGVEVEQKQ